MSNSNLEENLEQGFNEEELKDIISEIDQLEADFHDASGDSTADASPTSTEPELGLTDGDLSEGLGIEAAKVPSKPEDLSLAQAPANSNQSFVEETMSEVANEITKEEVEAEAEAEPEPAVEDNIMSAPAEEPVKGKVAEIVEMEPQPEVVEAPQAAVVEKPKASAGNAPSKMDFHVSGDMEMEFSFHIAGQKLDLVLNASEGFKLKLDGGVTASVPLDGAEGFVIELEGGAKFTLPTNAFNKAS